MEKRASKTRAAAGRADVCSALRLNAGAGSAHGAASPSSRTAPRTAPKAKRAPRLGRAAKRQPKLPALVARHASKPKLERSKATATPKTKRAARLPPAGTQSKLVTSVTRSTTDRREAPSSRPTAEAGAHPVLRVADVATPSAVGVRVGRLPPRGELGRARRPEPTESTWERVTAGALRLGVPSLSESQRQVIGAALEGRDVSYAAASGAGKSTVAAVLAQALDGLTLILSPRPALCREQYERLHHRRIACLWLDEDCTADALARLAESRSPLAVFATPAALLAREDLVAQLARLAPALVVVEEAHAFTDAAHELSPVDAQLGRLLARLGSPPMLALIGPVSFMVQREVASALGLRARVAVEGTAIRANVQLDVIRTTGTDRVRALVRVVQELRRPGMVLAPTPRDVDHLHAALTAARIPAHRYHDGLTPSERASEQLNFMLPGRRTVMVATSAFAPKSGLLGLDEGRGAEPRRGGFGLGLDKRDVRFVAHFGAPASLEQLARELGAAGRDGEDTRGLLFWDDGDSSRLSGELCRLRVFPHKVHSFARALEAQTAEARTTTLKSLALQSGLPLDTTELLARALETAGVVRVETERVSARSPAEVTTCSHALAARLQTLCKQDEQRLEAVRALALGSDCPRAVLERSLGTGGWERCGRCAACLHRSSTTGDGPTRRPPAEAFSVARVSGTAVPAPVPLTATLGDHTLVAQARGR